ncbi:amidohydrolase [Botrimarina hoheduenensis]|uniref:N-acetyldiaminopimelate deacetylase n=1 Tax=Botrimarina hoheduenensis TaxID=2528000 RepID=A0A5C5WB52_9BACT|nr:amidohydrolase [Botrimarina hoheduenensis]TWT47309.1 N-acetyldiaminopimelate deacetylase [Botrimarina hoheduenensis]
MARTLLAFVALFAPVIGAQAEEMQDWLDKNLPHLEVFYQELHAAPELSLKENATAVKLAEAWREAGFAVTQGVGGTGVVGVLENGSGPTLMLRCDMDALPIVEETGLPFASDVKTQDNRGATVGVMHACGHDLHMTNLLGAIRYLAMYQNTWQGKLVVIAQPAEELGEGAKAMLADGLFARFPRPDYAVAIHVGNDLPTGAVQVRPGFVGANVDSVDITVRGRGGHGAAPQTTIDPIVIAARLVLDLQTIVAREIKPTEPAVVTVGSIHGGSKHNIISDECVLQLTVRSYSPTVRAQLKAAILRKTLAAAASADAPEPQIDYSEGTPSLFNDPQLTERVAGVLRQTLGDANVSEGEPSMGAEDFSRYGRAGTPICMFRLGTIAPARLAELQRQAGGPPSLHSAKYYPDARESLRTGVPSLVAITQDLLPTE